MTNRTAKRQLICRLIILLRSRAQQKTLAKIYARYRACGGNRELDPKILEHLGAVPVAAFDRDFLMLWGRRLFPRLKLHERVRDFVEPLAEILNLPEAERAWWEARKLRLGADGMTPLTLEWAQAILGPVQSGWSEDYPDDDEDERERFIEIETRAPRTNDWAAAGPIPVAGPPPDPDPSLVADNYYKGATSRQWEAWDFRGQYSKSRLKDGTQVYPGPTPKGKRSAYDPNGKRFYLGYILGKPGRPRKLANAGEAQKPPPRPPGRPRKYASAAARKRAWRQRHRPRSC